MTKFDEVNLAWDAVDQATTALAARIQVLIDEINSTAGDGLDGPQTEAVLARLGALVTTLNSFGQDPQNPTPPLPEEATLPGARKGVRH